MKKNLLSITIVSLILVLVFGDISLNAQSLSRRDSIILAAREIIRETSYCALASVDSTGQPQVRTMNPFPANEDFIIWFATSRTSRKVREIRNNPKVSVYYANHVSAKGYVNITGNAEVIDDIDLLIKMKRDYWNSIPDWQEKFVLIKIIPKTLDVINYKYGFNNDPKTFRAPSITF
jgi:general stress protein 26